MHFIEKEAQRVAVMDSLISSDTGLALEIPVPPGVAEFNLLEASRLGESIIENFMRNFCKPATVS